MRQRPGNGSFLRQSGQVQRVIINVLVLTAVTVGCLVPGRPAEAVLYGSQAQLGETLYTIDPTTGAGTAVGPMGNGVTGIAVQPGTGVLYGATQSSRGSSIAESTLVTINTTTGAATVVGPFGVGLPRFTTLGDLAFDPNTGVLYGWSTGFSPDLYTVNLTSGAATKVGESMLNPLGGDGLAFNGTGTLYLAVEGTKGALRTVNTGTGLTTVGPTLNGFDICGCPEGEAIFALSFNGPTLFGVTALSDHLITINVATGLITDIGPAVGPDIGIEGIAFTAQAVDQVPEPTALTLTISGMTALILRRTLSGRAKRHV